jgi:hypothetical protein
MARDLGTTVARRHSERAWGQEKDEPFDKRKKMKTEPITHIDKNEF